MREVFSHPDVTEVGFYKTMLDAAGIPSFIRNENASTIGLVSAIFSPALCIVEDAQFDEAIRILKSRQPQGPISLTEWTCPACSEKNPPNFDSCWKCNAFRPGALKTSSPIP